LIAVMYGLLGFSHTPFHSCFLSIIFMELNLFYPPTRSIIPRSLPLVLSFFGSYRGSCCLCSLHPWVAFIQKLQILAAAHTGRRSLLRSSSYFSFLRKEFVFH
jgi:hypothetical protein